MGRYDEKDFRVAKNNMIDIVDQLTDAQRDIVSTEKYQDKQLRMMDKRVSSADWKFTLKYGTRVTNKCKTDADKLTKHYE